MKNYWEEKKAHGLGELELLIYRSNILGEDPAVTNWAGGNTSAKISEKDFRGRAVRVLRVKGSGTDLRTITRQGFPGVALEPVLELRSRSAMSDEEMVDYLAHCLVDLNAKRPSIDALIHALINHTHIDHMHPDAIIALCTAKNGPRLMKEIYGDGAAWLPWLRPGFALARQCGDVINDNPKLRAVILGKHGLITWGATAKESYDSTHQRDRGCTGLLQEATRQKRKCSADRSGSPPRSDVRTQFVQHYLPVIRGALSARTRCVVTFDHADAVLEFVNSRKLDRLAAKGAACPDHLVSTKLMPLVLKEFTPRDPGLFERDFRRALEKYVDDYANYFKKNKNHGDVMYDPFPRVILIPGIGMVAAGKDKATADITRDIYHRTISVIKKRFRGEHVCVHDPRRGVQC